MRGPKRWTFDEARAIAARCWASLEPHVARGQVVGSLRRRKPDVGDLEFLVEPKLAADDLFGIVRHDVAAVRKAAARWGSLVKSGDRYMQVILPEGIKVDLFVCLPPASWGSLLAIRTGPGDLGKLAMQRLLARGYRHEGGRVLVAATRATVPTDTEEQFFALADLPCVPPAGRDSLLAVVLRESEGATVRLDPSIHGAVS